MNFSDPCLGRRTGPTRVCKVFSDFPNGSADDRYVGALRSRITNSLDLPPDMSFAVTKLKDKLVEVIRVAQSKHRIAIGEEGILYVRNDGTNKKLAPNDWPPKEQDRPYGSERRQALSD